jgi:hypothetical protein
MKTEFRQLGAVHFTPENYQDILWLIEFVQEAVEGGTLKNITIYENGESLGEEAFDHFSEDINLIGDWFCCIDRDEYSSVVVGFDVHPL